MEHPNVQVMRDADEAMSRGDIEGFFSHYTADVTVHVRGQSRLAGDYQGLEQLQALFGRFMDAMGEYSFENHAYLADDEHGVMMQNAKAMRDGRTLELQELFIFHFGDGKFAEMWYLPTDQAAFDAWVG
jgi:ketosteroid isomerase-like protein